jgi:hypothetical protein
MKKSITRIVSIAALSAVGLFAQGPGQDDNTGSGTTIVARQVTFLTSFLTLTTSQAASATTIYTAALTSINTLETQIATARTALATAIKANATATINTQSAAIGTAEGQIVALNANADAAFYQLLTSTQQTTLATLNDFFGDGIGGIHIPGGGH